MPTLNELHLDSALTDFSVAVGMQNESNLVARRAFPPVNVAKQSDRYNVWSTASLLSADAQKRAPHTPSAGKEYRLSRDTYYADVFAVHIDISEQERANADEAWQIEESAARLLVNDLMITEDREFASVAFASSVWGTTVTGGTNFTVWSDAASTPIENIQTGKGTVLAATGSLPNKLVLGWNVFSALLNHPDIIDRIKYSQPGVLSEQIMASVFGVDEVLVSSAIRNTNAEGLANSSSFILGNHALLLVSPNGAGTQQASAGKTFVWTGLTGTGIRTKRYDIEELDAYPRIESDAAFDHKITAAALGYFFASAV